MGNRGILHDESNAVVRPWANKAWVTCLLSFKGIKRPRPFSPGNYSELFFLDEATAFAAGHRPCAFCQRDRNREFKTAWQRASSESSSASSISMPEIDKTLHDERVSSVRGKRTYECKASALPIGAMFAYQGTAYLVARQGCVPWSFQGYGLPIRIDAAAVVSVLTPPSVVRTFAAGLRPVVHPTAA
jgi:hypothetical protein